MKQQTNDRKSAWLTFSNKLSTDQFILFCENFLSLNFSKPIHNMVITLAGHPTGFNITGDLAQVKADLIDFIDPNFTNLSFRGILPQKGNLNFAIQLNPPLGQVSLNSNGGDDPSFSEIEKHLKDAFPASFFQTADDVEEIVCRFAKILGDSEKIISKSVETDEHFKEIIQNEVVIKGKLASIAQLEKTSSELAGVVKKSHQETQIANSEIGTIRGQIQNHRDAIQKSRDEIGAMEAKIKTFYEETEKSKASIAASKKSSEDMILNCQKKTEEIITQNQRLQIEIKEHLLKAVGTSLFSAFDARKSSLTISKWIWAGLSIIGIVAQIAAIFYLSCYLSQSTLSLPFYKTPEFLLRVTACIPIIFFIAYSIHQYAKERQYEEMYGFKAALSFSLAPYLDLVKQLDQNKDSAEQKKFVIDTIRQIFEDPVSRSLFDSKTLDATKPFISEILDKVIKLAEKSR